ncbi:MAG: hypothetical protein ACRD6X_20190 [Pyrinomonadaceae bacterium]
MTKSISIFVVACILGIGFIHGQSSNWRTFSSKDKTYSVEVPRNVGIEPVKSKDPKWKDTLLEVGVTGILMRVPGQESHRFSVLRIDLDLIPGFDKESKKLSEDDLVSYFAVMYTGEDDESQCLSEATLIDNGGIKGREYTYVLDDRANNGGGKLYTRSRLFLRNRKLFIVKFEGTKRDELTSSDANRFLTTFRMP